MRVSDKEWPRGDCHLPEPGPQKGRETVDSVKSSSVFCPSEPEQDTHLHACIGGLVFLTYTVLDEEMGEVVERIEAIPCRLGREACMGRSHSL
jgi:hypothetical protein